MSIQVQRLGDLSLNKQIDISQKDSTQKKKLANDDYYFEVTFKLERQEDIT